MRRRPAALQKAEMESGRHRPHPPSPPRRWSRSESDRWDSDPTPSLPSCSLRSSLARSSPGVGGCSISLSEHSRREAGSIRNSECLSHGRLHTIPEIRAIRGSSRRFTGTSPVPAPPHTRTDDARHRGNRTGTRRMRSSTDPRCRDGPRCGPAGCPEMPPGGSRFPPDAR